MSDIVKQSTIGAKLRKLFSNNKQTVAENIPEEKEFPVPAAPIGSDPSADSGKVPTVQDDGSYALATPSGGTFVVHSDDGTLDKTMGEIQEAFLRNDRIELQDNSGGGVLHSIVVHLYEVHLDGRSHTYEGSVTFANSGNNITPHKFYTVSAATESDALAAYPALR